MNATSSSSQASVAAALEHDVLMALPKRKTVSRTLQARLNVGHLSVAPLFVAPITVAPISCRPMKCHQFESSMVNRFFFGFVITLWVAELRHRFWRCWHRIWENWQNWGFCPSFILGGTLNRATKAHNLLEQTHYVETFPDRCLHNVRKSVTNKK